MNKVQYFLAAINANLYTELEWCIAAFSAVVKRPTLSEATHEFQLIYDGSDPKSLFTTVRTDGNLTAVKIIGSDINTALFKAKEGVDIKEGDIKGLVTGNINTSYGIILGNMYLLHYPFGGKFKFINDVIDGGFDKSLSTLLRDTPKDGKPRNPNFIYPDEYMRYGEACGAVAGLDKLFSTAGSANTLSVSPTVIELRDRLIKEHAHELDDIRVQANIEQQLVAADKESFKGDDDALDFLVSRKSFNPTRKKQLIMVGGSSGFGGANGGTASFIPTSLKDGWDIKDLPVYANEARSGSFFRGKETALGGTEVKNATRMAQNFKLIAEFCNTDRGKPEMVTEETKRKFVGRNIKGMDGVIAITKDNVDSYVGKRVEVYSPQYCKVPGDGYCNTCIGANWSLLKDGLGTALTNIGDVLMAERMGRMHGKALVPYRFNFLANLH